VTADLALPFAVGCTVAGLVVAACDYCRRVKKRTRGRRAERVRLIEQARRSPQVYPEGPDVTWRRSQ
jgi:hypothetical protein